MSKNIQTYCTGPYFQWGTVFAGTVIAVALTIVFTQFGAAIGLADDAPLRGAGTIATWGYIAAGIWILWVQLISSMAGGYVAGYLRCPSVDLLAHENEMRDGIYGIAVWATSTIIVFIGAALFAASATTLAVATDTPEVVETINTTEQNMIIISAFLLGASSLVSGAVAWWAATMGGEHRANKVEFAKWSFRNK